MNKIYYSDKEFEQVLLSLSSITEELHALQDEAISEKINALMQHFDVIHRESLSRLWNILEVKHPDLCERIIKEDYTVRNILALYDIIEYEGIKTPIEPLTFIPYDQVGLLNKNNK